MSIYYGKGVKPEKVESAISKWGGLIAGEEIWFAGRCNNLRPLLDSIVVTNIRLIGYSTIQGAKYLAPTSRIVDCEFDDAKGQAQITTSDGQIMIFKSIPREDVSALNHYVSYARTHPPSAALAAALDESQQAASTVLAIAGETPADFKNAKRALEDAEKESRAASDRERKQEQAEAKQRIRDEESQARREAEEALRSRVGRQVASASFAAKSIEIYDKGYVRVALLMTKKTEYERLVSISASADVSKKSGLGRGVAAVATMGVNLASSNKRGDVYLTIVTDKRTYSLHDDPPTAMNLKASKKLEAAGNAVINAANQNQVHADAPHEPSEQPLSERLQELTRLRDEGLVSPEEFDSLRRRLLDSL